MMADNSRPVWARPQTWLAISKKARRFNTPVKKSVAALWMSSRCMEVRRSAARRRARGGSQLCWNRRLADKVVGAVVERADDMMLIVARRHHQDVKRPAGACQC